jgi:hypothetical protein
MTLIDRMKRPITDFLWLRALRTHKSRLGRHAAPAFTAYLERCRRHSPAAVSADPAIKAAADTFNALGVTHIQTEASRELAQALLQKIAAEEQAGPIWDADGRYANGDIFEKFEEIEDILRGDAGDLVRSIYGAHFKIFFGVLYRSVRDHDEPEGSQLWHADGGPGTCINLMYCLSPVSAKNGSMECLPWPESVEIFAGERAALRAAGPLQGNARREARAAYYGNEIARRFADRVVQPESGPGLIYAFRNNCVHKGGFVEPGNERYVIVFHVYPSIEPTPFETYRQTGIGKREANPEGPAF